jgi:hypothetical protein
MSTTTFDQHTRTDTNRDYLYRIPLDDRRAIRKVNRLDSLGMRWINKVHHSTVGGREVMPCPYVFYETVDGSGHIPGLKKYVYSKQWEKFPHDGLLEMRHANGGGTKIRGERHVGHDLATYVWVDFVTPFTPGDIKKMYDGDSVPDPRYGDRGKARRNGRMLEADEAMHRLNDDFHWAEQDAIDEIEEEFHEKRWEALEECDHGDGQYLERGAGAHEAFCHKCEFAFTRDELDSVGLQVPERETR